jgi:hypothetical protein
MIESGPGALEILTVVSFWILIVAGGIWLVSRLFPQTAGSSRPSRGSQGDVGSSPADEIKK